MGCFIIVQFLVDMFRAFRVAKALEFLVSAPSLDPSVSLAFVLSSFKVGGRYLKGCFTLAVDTMDNAHFCRLVRCE